MVCRIVIMDVIFNIVCHTRFGQNLKVEVDGKEHPMAYVDNGRWSCAADCASGGTYRYVLTDVDGSEIEEPWPERYLPKGKRPVTMNDEFRYSDMSSVFMTTPFTDVFCKPRAVKELPRIHKEHSLIVANVPMVRRSQGVAIMGEAPLLGGWDATRMLPLIPSGGADWYIQLPTDQYLTHSEYKFVIYDKETGTIAEWESGENRRLPLLTADNVYSYSFRRERYDWHGAGVAIPVFSIRTRNDWGAGDFLSIKKMVDWAAANGLAVIQILPVNDTVSTFTEADSYPYRANSIYALHPMYLNMDAIGTLHDRAAERRFRRRAAVLNALPAVDYLAVNELKSEYASLMYVQRRNALLQDREFVTFVKENLYWLKPYAAFCLLRDRHGSGRYSEWGEYAVYSEEKADALFRDNEDHFNCCYYVQYNLHQQLREAREYAHSKGDVLKGDLPIGVSADSVDAWMEPHLFNVGCQAGAPPDDFSEKGQNWSLPTYNWEEMAKDGYRWWQRRFRNMANYFDAFRIDHILGFFRIWEIPQSAVWGLLGHFNPALPMTVQEIEAYGLRFERERFVKPYVDDELLSRLLPDEELRGEAKAAYLECRGDGTYSFREMYDTQRKVHDTFGRKDLTERERALYDALMAMHTEVLFIEDDKRPGYYSPRITVMKTRGFECLDGHQKWCVTRIHDEFYYHRHNDFWRDEAMRKLPALLKGNRMLVCGEDLGMVPPCVPEVMHRLYILSLEIERMPKDIHTRFATPDKTPYLSVSSTGTHDTQTLRGWWRDERAQVQEYYNTVLGHDGDAPAECTPEIAREIVGRQLHGNSMLAILPWQDYMACDAQLRCKDIDRERINVPENPNHYWRYRMHLPVEDLRKLSGIESRAV